MQKKSFKKIFFKGQIIFLMIFFVKAFNSGKTESLEKVKNDLFSGVRGEHALNVVKYRNLIEGKLAENRRAVKESVQLTEKLRAAQVR